MTENNYTVCLVLDATKKKPYTFIVDESYKNNDPVPDLNTIRKKYFSVTAKNEYWAQRMALLKYDQDKFSNQGA
mgnify:CR=1 FL=1